MGYVQAGVHGDKVPPSWSTVGVFFADETGKSLHLESGANTAIVTPVATIMPRPVGWAVAAPFLGGEESPVSTGQRAG